MKRDPIKLTNTTYDLLIIGAGINGACAAWDAALRGLSVAIIDKGDFGAATSANSLKVIHGGLRYLQKADISRMRMSIRERSSLMRIAPHFINSFPCLIPTYGHYKQGREIMRLALKINDIIGFDRNQHIDSKKIIPAGRIISKEDCLGFFPYFNNKGLKGGAIWYDCQVHNSERLTLSFLLSAANAGTDLCNYVEVKDFIKKGNKILGVKAIDILNNQKLEIQANMILNVTGPWSYKIMDLCKSNGSYNENRSNLALAINLVSKQSIVKAAVGVKSKTPREHDAVCGGNRFMFIMPWGKSTLFGTSYKIFYDNVDNYSVSEELLQELLDEFNEVCPGLGLSFENISFYHRGIIPINRRVNPDMSALLLENHKIIDHEISDGISGLISIVGIKYTTARYVAEKAVDLVFQKLRKNSPNCETDKIPIYGGEIECSQNNSDNFHVSKETENRLMQNYGSRYKDVLRYAQSDPLWAEALDKDSYILRCEILHAVRAEMAVKLSDVVFRRTDMGTINCPSTRQLEITSQIMGEELSWNKKKQQDEISEVLHTYAPLKVA